MIRQLPVIPTILVVAAAGVMVWLGFWQLGRADEKAAMIAQYEAALKNEAPVPFPAPVTSANVGLNSGEPGQDLWFRRSTIECNEVLSREPVAGTSARGAKGWAIRVRATCNQNGRVFPVTIDLGFARDPNVDSWENGVVAGFIAPGRRLVASPAVASLEPLAKPNPNDLPNNHLAYAGQWFFFALTALVIYFFAVRSKLARRD